MSKPKKAEKPKLSKKEAKKLAEKAAKAEARAAAEKKAAKAGAQNAAEPKAKKAKKGEAQNVAEPKVKKAKKGEAEKPAPVETPLAAEHAAERETMTNDEIDAAIKARLAKKTGQPGSHKRLAALQKSVEAERDAKKVEREATAERPDITQLAEAVGAETFERARAQLEAGQGRIAERRPKPTDTAPAALFDTEPLPEATPATEAEREDEAAPAPVAPTVDADEFAKPSEAPKRWEDDTNGLGQYKVVRPSDGKTVGYTRVTTYIDALEDKSQLTKWKMRVLLEGVATAEEMVATGALAESPTAKIRDLAHQRDVAIAKARKADRKGKLVPGQLATLVDGATADFKRAINLLADELFEIGGGREKAQKGTDLHALVDLYDAEGIDAVGAKLQAGEITPADLADVEAYSQAVNALGLKVVHAEQVIVNDELKVAGRLDRVFLAKLPAIIDPKTGEELRPADTRAKRYVGDLKTGNVEYSAGKIAQQIRAYAEGEAYDTETGTRSSHGANRTTGILIHLPAGSAKATIHLVDLGIGGHGNKIVGEVRAFRNLGKKAIDLKTDLVQVATSASAEGGE